MKLTLKSKWGSVFDFFPDAVALNFSHLDSMSESFSSRCRLLSCVPYTS
jgi:hypothetical protein